MPKVKKNLTDAKHQTRLTHNLMSALHKRWRLDAYCSGPYIPRAIQQTQPHLFRRNCVRPLVYAALRNAYQQLGQVGKKNNGISPGESGFNMARQSNPFGYNPGHQVSHIIGMVHKRGDSSAQVLYYSLVTLHLDELDCLLL